MAGLKLDIANVYPFVSEESILGFQEQAQTQLTSLNDKTGAGNDFLGWLDLPSNIPEDEINKIEEVAAFLHEKAEIIVVVGIGGSYLGAKSIISAMSHNFDKYKAGKKGPDVIFAGQNIGEDYLSELIEVLDTHSYAIIVISKSGTTTEPAIAFRILKEHLEKKVGSAEANQRIIAITDKSKGALRKLSDQVGYRSFIIPDDVGGRYSVLTPVGILPIACAGYDIREFIKGAIGLKEQTGPDTPLNENPAALYAAARNALYRNGRSIEILANYNEKLIYFSAIVRRERRQREQGHIPGQCEFYGRPAFHGTIYTGRGKNPVRNRNFRK
jgi:glucose-6-phosphate isomerase